MDIKSKEEILKEREKSGLLFILYFRMFYMASTIGGTLIVGQSLMERVVVSIVMTLAIIGTIVYWFILRKGHYFRLIGYSGAIFDVFVLLLIPILWHESVGGDSVSRAYILKSSTIHVLSYVILLIHSLVNRPAYTLVVTVGVLFNHLIYYLYSISDPKIIFTTDLKEHNLGNAFSPFIYMNFLFSFFASGIIFSIFLRKNHLTLLEAVNSQRQNDQLGRYFSPQVFQELRAGDDKLFQPGGRKQTVVVMFADIRGFTKLSEELIPEEITMMLSEYHELMVDAIFQFEGTLDKFIGDGIMATFGTPNSRPDDAYRAVQAGLLMKRKLDKFNQKRIFEKKQVIRQGIGIHMGEAIVGNIGSKDRLEFTVIGDTVNVASRVESACKKLEREFLITSAVKEKLGELVPTEDVGLVQLRGKSHPIRLYSIHAD